MLWCARLGLRSPSSPGSPLRGASVPLQGLAMGQEGSLHLQPHGNGFVPLKSICCAPAPAPLSSVAAEGTGHSLDRERCEQRSVGSSEIEDAIALLIHPVASGLSAQANTAICF